MLPGLDGFTVGQRLKKAYPGLPILMLSARTSIDDKLQGLEFADDYLTKPFHPDELAARLEVLLRRSVVKSAEPIRVKHLSVYENENRIVNEDTGEEMLLTGKQHQIFMYLLQHVGRVMTKEQIYESVWGESYIEGDKTLMVHMLRHSEWRRSRGSSFKILISTKSLNSSKKNCALHKVSAATGRSTSIAGLSNWLRRMQSETGFPMCPFWRVICLQR